MMNKEGYTNIGEIQVDFSGELMQKSSKVKVYLPEIKKIEKTLITFYHKGLEKYSFEIDSVYK